MTNVIPFPVRSPISKMSKQALICAFQLDGRWHFLVYLDNADSFAFDSDNLEQAQTWAAGAAKRVRQVGRFPK